MGDLTWRLKQFFRKIFPIALIGAFLYGGYNLYKAGAFRRGFGPAVSSMLRQVPYFGSRFKHYAPSNRKQYSYKGKSSRQRKAYRKSRRQGRRR